MENLIASRCNTSNTLNESSVNQIKAWIESCSANHEVCGIGRKLNSSQKNFPTRLLQIDNMKNISLKTTEGLSPDTNYVTLSHCMYISQSDHASRGTSFVGFLTTSYSAMNPLNLPAVFSNDPLSVMLTPRFAGWGTNPIIRLLKETHSSFSLSIPWPLLPRTFQHAIDLTQTLGFDYIWIDSLCIIQDSKEDWQKESARMGDVYSQSHVNIAATASSDGSGGLYHRENSLAINPCLIEVTESNSQIPRTFLCYQETFWNEKVENGPLGKRGWVLQERILSPRVVHFASNQMFWECGEMIAAEFLPSNFTRWDPDLKNLKTSRPHVGDEAHSERLYEAWGGIVRKYSQCDLTYESDKLIAISGLAQRACRQLGLESKDYLAGLWKAYLPGELLWQTNRGEGNRGKVADRAPSWSWASVNGAITCASPVPNHARVHARVLEANVFQLSDSFGQVSGGQIRLQAPISKVTFRQVDLLLAASKTPFTADLDGTTGTLHCYSRHVDWDDETCSESAEKNEGFFLIMHSQSNWYRGFCAGLMIQHTGLNRGQYRRLGKISGRIQGVDALLKAAIDPSLLEARLYSEADPEKGFIVEII